MNNILLIIASGIFSGIIGIFLWMISLKFVRNNNFNSSGRRPDKPIRGTSNDVRSNEINYHNEAIYRDFEYFFKTTAAIIGGTAYLIIQTRSKEIIAVLSLLIQLSSILQILTTFTISVFILSHQKSKIERWKSSFNLSQILFWQETWIIFVMWFVAGIYSLATIPLILQKLI